MDLRSRPGRLTLVVLGFILVASSWTAVACTFGRSGGAMCLYSVVIGSDLCLAGQDFAAGCDRDEFETCEAVVLAFDELRGEDSELHDGALSHWEDDATCAPTPVVQPEESCLVHRDARNSRRVCELFDECLGLAATSDEAQICKMHLDPDAACQSK